MISLIIAIGLATLSCLAGEFLPKSKALLIYAFILTGMSATYIGLAIADGRRDRIVMEMLATVAFTSAGLFAIWGWSRLLVVGFIAQAIWALLHHPGSVGARVKPWFAFSAIMYAAIMAAYLYLRLLR